MRGNLIVLHEIASSPTASRNDKWGGEIAELVPSVGEESRSSQRQKRKSSLHQEARHDIFEPVAIEEVIRLLEQEYGAREWHADRDPIDVLIETILSQNTSDANSGRAFASLKANFDSWKAVSSAPAEHIAQAIKCGGLSQIKAVRIKQVLQQIEKDQGRISLNFLKSKPMAKAEEYLLRLPGVGHKTASCVLLFSLGKPSLPVDTHVFRVARRLGLIDSNVSVDKAHSLLQERVPRSEVYQFHVHTIEHGRRICHARQPHCHKCILRGICPSSRH